MTVATSDGERLWAFRYSSEGRSRSLFHSTDVRRCGTSTRTTPSCTRCPTTRLVVSEPLGDLKGAWSAVPEATSVLIHGGRRSCGRSRRGRPCRGRAGPVRSPRTDRGPLMDTTAYPTTPPGWTPVARRSIGPFTTHVTYRRSDGSTLEWSSRSHRKHASRLSRAHRRELALWAPRRRRGGSPSCSPPARHASSSPRSRGSCNLVGPPRSTAWCSSSGRCSLPRPHSCSGWRPSTPTAAEPTAPAAAAAELRTPPDRLVELRHPAPGDAVLQRDHLPGAADRARLAVLRPGGVAAGRARFGLLPRLGLPGLRRGLRGTCSVARAGPWSR